MNTRLDLLKEILEKIRTSGDLVTATNLSGNGFVDYLFYSYVLKRWTVYSLSFLPEDVEKIEIRKDGIFIFIK